MSKKKATATKTTTESTQEQTPPEQTPGQKYEKQLQQVVDDWPEKALKLLEADVLALDAPSRKIEPRTSDPALLRRLGPIGGDAVNGWIVLPDRPPAPQMPETLKSKPTGLDMAGWYDAEKRRIG